MLGRGEKKEGGGFAELKALESEVAGGGWGGCSSPAPPKPE